MSEQAPDRLEYGVPACAAARDSVDRILLDWHRERPDLDFTPVGVVTRLARVRAHLDSEVSAVFSRYGLSSADFGVIITLRRAGEPFEMPQARLMEALGLTSGTVSVRLDRLVRGGIVTRGADPSNARVSLITLTDKGRLLFDTVTPVHLANEDRLLSALDTDERTALADLLRRLLADFEAPSADVDQPLGLTLEPAHRARSRRTGVGLTDHMGLLVLGVAAHSGAAAAGLELGDLITAVDGRPVISTVGLTAQLAEALPTAALEVQIRRGDQLMTLAVLPAAADDLPSD